MQELKVLHTMTKENASFQPKRECHNTSLRLLISAQATTSSESDSEHLIAYLSKLFVDANSY